MLREIFDTVLKMELVASMAAMAVLPVKYLLQRAGIPRKVLFWLWLVIVFRLVSPVSVSTGLSLFNLIQPHNTPQSEYVAQAPVGAEQPVPDAPPAAAGETTLKYTRYATEKAGMVLPLIWLTGTAGMLMFGAVSYILLKRRLRFAVRLKDNVYTADNIPTSFVFGILRPKIYIPEGMLPADIPHIILHERTHIKRADHLTKMFAYILLSVHWLNPLSWLMYKLISADMEYICDAGAVAKLGATSKKEYLQALLNAAAGGRNGILFSSVCFSGSTAKRRIKHLLAAKKASKPLSACAVLMCLALATGVGTNALPRAVTSVAGSGVPQDGVGLDVFPELCLHEKYNILMRTLKPANTHDTTGVPTTDTEPAPPQTINTGGQQAQKSESFSDAATDTAGGEHGQTVQPDDADTAVIQTHPDSGQTGIDFQQVILDTGTRLKDIQQELGRQGVTQSHGGAADLATQYIIAPYSYESDCNSKNSGITCDANGSISLYFDVNAENLVNIAFSDCETGEPATQFEILAQDGNAYTFFGFDREKAYDVVVQGQTQGNWEIEGEYILY